MKWGGPSKQNSQRPYGEFSSPIAESQSQLLHTAASSSYLPLAGFRSGSVEDDAPTRSAKPLRLFKHKRDNDEDSNTTTSNYVISSPSVNLVAPSPTGSSMSTFGSPDLSSRSVESFGPSQHMSLSKSMNDLAYFSRSPTTRDLMAIDYSPTEHFKSSFGSSSRSNPRASSAKPTASSRAILKQGWLNKHEIDPKRGGKNSAWKLQRAVLEDSTLHLYKPPSDIGVKSFDFSNSFSKLSISKTIAKDVTHQGLSRHPDLVVDENGEIISGSIEAICHEILLGSDLSFASDALLLLPMWADAIDGLNMLGKVASVGIPADRLVFVLTLITDKLGSLLLDDAVNESLSGILQLLEDKERDTMIHRMTTKRSQLNDIVRYRQISDVQTNVIFSEYRNGLTVDGFLNIDLEILATQIHNFDLRVFRNWNPINDFSLLYGTKYKFTLKNPLTSSSTFPHFLGATMVRQIFSCTTPNGNSPSFVCNLLSRWILLGNRLKQRGDMVGWLAIASIVCSPAVCRLTEVWSLVSLDLIDIVNRDWAPVVVDVDRRAILGDAASRRESSHILAPDGIGTTYSKDWVVPYFGDIGIHCLESMAEINRDFISVFASRQELIRIRKTLERWTAYITSIEDQDRMSALEPQIPALQECLYSLFKAHISAPLLTPTALMEMSLNYEPPTTGQYAQFYASQKSPLSNGSYCTILFTDVLPSYKLFAQRDLLEAGGLLSRKSSSSLKSKTSADPLVPQGHGPGQQTRHLRRASSFPPSRVSINITGYSDLDATSRNRVASFPDGHLLIKSVRDVLNIGVSLYHVGDDLVLKSFKEDTKRSSRLSSVIIENPSKRISTGSRRLSAQFQASTLETQFAEYRLSTTQVINVVAKSGTFARLVDILVLGVEDFSSNIWLEDISHLSRLGQASLRMDMDIFTATFFATYHNFSSPSHLLDCLRVRFLGARDASAALHLADKFPDWKGSAAIDSQDCDWTFVGKVHIGILEALNFWVSEHYSDLVSELHLRESFLDLLAIISEETEAWKERRNDDRNLTVLADTIESLARSLKKSFGRKSYRPIEHSRWPAPPPSSPDTTLEFPDSSVADIERFCDSVDAVISYVFKQIQLKDWLAVFEIFETQTVDPLKMFSNKASPLSSDDDIAIQDVFGFCSSLYCYRSDELMVSLLPKPVKNLYAFRMNLVSWIVLHIADPTLKKSSRVKRMAALLHCIAFCRQRMSVIEFGGHQDQSEQPIDHAKVSIPSLIESAISAAIVRPESRQYAASWLKAAHNVGKNVQQVDCLEDIIPSFAGDANHGPQPLTPLAPCMGWIFERIFEIVCYVPNMAVENPVMVNFDKQRYIYNFLSNVLDIKSSHLDEVIETGNPAAFFLNTDITARFDKRQVKEAAAKEAKDFNLKGSKGLRAFQGLVSLEQEKVRRDGRQREVLERHIRDLSRANYNRGRMPVSAVDKRSYKPSRFGGLLRAVRPISMAFSSNFSPPLPDRSVSPMELPEVSSIESKHRPTASISLVGSSTVIPEDMIGMGVFKIVCADGTDFLFQATSVEELDDWVKMCSAVRSATAEQLDPSALTKVFGVSISTVCSREGTLIPTAVKLLLSEIESRGIEEVGIYRVPGSLASVNALKRAIDSGDRVDMDDSRWFDINTVAGCLKLYLRELPEPLLTDAYFAQFTQIAKLPDEAEQIYGFAAIVQKLPPSNYHLLKRIIEHLALIADHGSINKMHAVNLAIVFSMSLLPVGNTSSMSTDLGSIQTMLRTMITYTNKIFIEGFVPGTPTPSLRVPGSSRSVAEMQTEDGFGPVVPPPVPAKDIRPVGSGLPSGGSSPTKRESFHEVSVF